MRTKVEILRALARAHRQVADLGEELAAVEAAGADAEIFSTRVGEWPPHAKTRRAARDSIVRVRSHVRLGKGRASVVTCTRTAFFEAHGRPAPRLVDAPPAPVVDDDEAIVSRAFAKTLRATRRTA